MLGKYASYCFALGELLLRLHRQLGLPLPPAFNPGLSLSGFGSLGGLLGTVISPDTGASDSNAPAGLQLPAPPLSPAPNSLTKDEKEDIDRNLGFVEYICNELGMAGIIKDVTRAKKDAALLFADRNKMQFHIEHITERLIEELDQEHFFHVPVAKEKYCRKENLFGEKIGKKFEKCQEDITNAGTAYALGLYTACVFHLMRVLEHCVQRFGTKLKITLDVKNESWSNIIDQVSKEIERMPGGPRAAPAIKATPAQRARRQKMALAASRLDHVRLVWRNDVMHPKATYDETEALRVLNSVQEFLESIVTLV